ncbi:hypothetical protein B0I08_101109 [Glaciihabitans tibetensis]|uniref:Uncharacterized protein n=1 Tax=Glaciihabitans tibetensis TaxID=1266600 RepID=A0A2T0VIG4_9MICO|nr:hypothetical protein [Glaciihabitans tibetensis]PRY69987.1 hypothetical protein B0I08_101109 [Glaciihabitans tibetensis]
MLLIEVVRRWGLIILGVALLIVGVIVVVEVPDGDSRVIVGWGMSLLGVVLGAVGLAAEVRRNHRGTGRSD